jgi:hypothetical protein
MNSNLTPSSKYSLVERDAENAGVVGIKSKAWVST